MKSLLLIDNRINDISTVTQSLNIDVSSLQPGVYWAVIYQGEKRDVRKLVINP